jgi:hypothetical protein
MNDNFWEGFFKTASPPVRMLPGQAHKNYIKSLGPMNNPPIKKSVAPNTATHSAPSTGTPNSSGGDKVYHDQRFAPRSAVQGY